MAVDSEKLISARRVALEHLMSEKNSEGHWVGHLSSSALSTATAIVALRLATDHNLLTPDKAEVIMEAGLKWLEDHVNPDGGWGDTIKSHTNLSTTALCWAAFGACHDRESHYNSTILRCERRISEMAGGLSPEALAPAIIRRYGKDRTFSVPILTMCALSGRLGTGRRAWKKVIPLPFELAALPHSWFAALRLPVVSYALPALIAIGLVRHVKSPSRWPWVRLIRQKSIARVLLKLESIQPENGGFLEATPLTSFVTMSMIAAGFTDSPVVAKGLEFLIQSQEEDGSWAIDTNLSTWVTSLAINASYSGASDPLKPDEKQTLSNWLIKQQYREVHPYTEAPPGGWAWTPLPGGVPDADDTPGALIALQRIGSGHPDYQSTVKLGCQWLVNLQNNDGGIPTFCKGWGKLPFDKSSPDLTAHTIRAWLACRDSLEKDFSNPSVLIPAIQKAVKFLSRSQNRDGSWNPLWFGNQWRDDESNPVYGTSRVVCAVAEVLNAGIDQLITEKTFLIHPAQYLIENQNEDGSWGQASPLSGTIEESAQAIEALCKLRTAIDSRPGSPLHWKNAWDPIIEQGLEFLADRVHDGSFSDPQPIGFYFANLWYYERLYPVVMVVAALEAAGKAD